MTQPAAPPPSLSVPARFIATAGGAGYSPIAPGTCGTIVAVGAAYLLRDTPMWQFAMLTAVVTVIGIWAAHVADQCWGTHDSGRIVIDEVAGYFVTIVAFDRTSVTLLLVSFVLFRAFDIIKPPPVRWLDHNLPGGVGVVVDDLAAGIYAAIIVAVLHWTGVMNRLADALNG